MDSFPSPLAASSSSSSSSTNSRERYDVFLSFRGKDTRCNFTSHLHAALDSNNILSFIDYNLERGEEISPSLLKAIEESKISVVILSQDYASSKWCLEELVKIIECKRDNGQIVMPVFYHVDPSHVRNQTGSYEDAFAQYEESSLVSLDKVQSWRAALREVANLSGQHLTIDRQEAEVIKEIIGDILKKLSKMAPIYSPKGLVGIQARIQEVESLLCLGSADVRFVGIWGMGGLGKTTLAEIIYDRISPQFESCCFLSNTREELQGGNLHQLQDKLFSALLKKESSTLNLRLSFIKDRLCRRKVLVVIDDVDNSTKLQQLLLGGEGDLFGSGSRILVTSRDKQVLKNIVGDEIYEMQKLNRVEANQLFSLKAFKREFRASYYASQSTRVIDYADGNPLALIVLGSALFDRSAEDWESMLKRLGNIPNNEIHNVLRTSFDALNLEEQSIFLDISCLYRGVYRDHVNKVWGGYYPSIQFSITTLIDRSLITSRGNWLEMHTLLQEMGQNIVLAESAKPENRSRLWKSKDICYVLKENKGTEATEGISFDMSKAEQIRLKRDSFVRMSGLRFLNFYYSSFSYDELIGKGQVWFDDLESLPDELRYFHWTKFPMKSLPSRFSPENLVVLKLPRSNVKKLWTGTQNLANLKEIDLSRSPYLTRTTDLSMAINIEKINLYGCESLEEVHSSIQYLNKLEFIDLRYCRNLRTLPRRIDSKVLKVLKIYDSPEVKKEGLCLDFQGNHQLQELKFDCRAIKDERSTISSIEISSTLKELSLHNCKHLKSLLDRICNLESLWYLNVEGSAIKEIPSSIENLHCLRILLLRDCKNLEILPTTIHKLPRLTALCLKSCESLRTLPELPPFIEDLDANNCKSLETVSISFSKYGRLSSVNFGNCLKLDLKALGLEAQNRVKEVLSFRFLLIYPGSEIPKWFSHQSKGSSVTTGESSSNLDQFTQITYSLVFEFKKSVKNLFLYYFRSNTVPGHNKGYLNFFCVDDILADTDHVLIWKRDISQEEKSSCDDLFLGASFDPKYENNKHFRVKACGLNLV